MDLPRFLQLEGVTREERYAATARAESALGEAGGWVLDCHLFSNRALTLVFAVAARDLPRLARALRGTGLAFDEASRAQLDACAAEPSEPAEPPARDVHGTLRLVFVHEQPDVPHPVPAVPG